jgi:hypothetical protein
MDGALRTTFAAPPKLRARSHRAKFDKAAMANTTPAVGTAGRHAPPTSVAQAGQSVVVAGGSTQRLFSLRSMLPGQQILTRPKSGALRRSGDASKPLAASNGQLRPASSPNSLLRKKATKVHQNAQELSPFLYRPA